MLSPATVMGLMATHMSHEIGVDRALANLLEIRRAKRPGRPEPERVVMWRCPICDELHDDEDDAADCCSEADDSAATPPETAACICPVCGTDHGSVSAAADCCLWHDLAKEQREEVARRVAEGATWLQAIEAVDGQLPVPLRHLRNEQPTE